MINKKSEFKNIIIDKIVKSEMDIGRDVKDDNEKKIGGYKIQK